MKKQNIKEKEEQLESCPERVTTQIIDGCKYVIHSHFIGEKDLDETIRKLSFESAFKEVSA